MSNRKIGRKPITYDSSGNEIAIPNPRKLVYFILQPNVSGLSPYNSETRKNLGSLLHCNRYYDSIEYDEERDKEIITNSLRNLWLGKNYGLVCLDFGQREHLLKDAADICGKDFELQDFPKDGWDYLVKNSYVKIGKCEPKNEKVLDAIENQEAVSGRLSGCQTGNPNTLFSLGYIWGSESYWHNEFREYKVRGEWFMFEPIMKALKDANMASVKAVHENEHRTINLKDLDVPLSEEALNLQRWKQEQESEQHNFRNVSSLGPDVWYAFEGDTWTENMETLEIFISILFTNYSEYAMTRGVLLTKKRKSSMVDMFGDRVEVGEYYYRDSTDRAYQCGAKGISLKNAIVLYGEVDWHIKRMVKKEKENREEKERIEWEKGAVVVQKNMNI